MKKIYTSPAIEIETIEVEQGIALSPASMDMSAWDMLQDATYTETDFQW